jgi:hypothetical protein
MFGVKIDDEFLENPKDGEVTFELNFGGFQDAVIPGSFTFPANYPSGEVNDRLLKNGRFVDAAKKVIYHDGELYLFNNFYDRCKVVRLETTEDVYRVSNIINGMSIDIKGKTLRDIVTTPENRTFDKISELLDFINWCNDSNNEHLFVFPRILNAAAFEEIADSAPYLKNFYDGIINRFVDEDVIVPYVYFGDDEQPFKRYFLSPQIREVKLLELLFAQFGYSVNGSFVNNAEARTSVMYSNRLIKADRKELIQVGCKSYSDAKPTGTFYNWPSLSIDSDPTNQDYNATLDVWVNNYEFLNIYEDELPKIKIDSSLNYDVGIKGTINASTENVTMTIMVIEPATPSDVGGDVLNQFTFNIDVAPDEDLDYLFHQQFNFGAALGPTPPSEVIIAVGFRTNVDDADFSIQNFIVSIVPDLAVEADAEIEPINCAEFLPDTPIEDWLVGLKKQYNLNFQYNPFNRIVTIDYLDDCLKKPFETVDHRMGKKLPIKTSDNSKGFTIQYDLSSVTDQLTEDNFKDLDPALFQGFSQPETKSPGAYYFDPSTGQVMKFGYNSIRWSFYSDAYYPLVVGEGEKDITISGRTPIFMRRDNDNVTVQAAIKTPMHFPRFGISADQFSDIRVSYFRGDCPSIDGTLRLPTASTMVIAADGETVIGESEMWLRSDRDSSIYSLRHKRWISFIKTAERLRDRIEIDMPFLQRIFDTQKKIRNSVFLAAKLIFTVSGSKIKEAEIEMYRNNYEYE